MSAETFTEWRITGERDGEVWEHGCPSTDEAATRAIANDLAEHAYNDMVRLERRVLTASPWELAEQVGGGQGAE